MGRRKPPTAPSLVYVVRNDRDALLKIGTTTDLPRRMRELSRLCKGRVTCLATFPGDDTLERALHATCAVDLVAGEWFRPSARVTALVEAMRRKSTQATETATSPTFARNLPPWVAVELRPSLPTCGCVQLIRGIAYAQGACGACHGAGVTFVAPIVRAA